MRRRRFDEPIMNIVPGVSPENCGCGEESGDPCVLPPRIPVRRECFPVSFAQFESEGIEINNSALLPLSLKSGTQAEFIIGNDGATISFFAGAYYVSYSLEGRSNKDAEYFEVLPYINKCAMENDRRRCNLSTPTNLGYASKSFIIENRSDIEICFELVVDHERTLTDYNFSLSVIKLR